MILKNLLKIDEGRIDRSRDIKVILSWTRMLTTPRKGFWSKLWGFIKNEPYIITTLLKFECTNVKSGSKYNCYLEMDPVNSRSKLLQAKVKIFCSCNDFKYRSAYILNKENNLFHAPAIDKHLGIALTEAPKIVVTTNICKHLYAVINYVRNNLTTLNLTY